MAPSGSPITRQTKLGGSQPPVSSPNSPPPQHAAGLPASRRGPMAPFGSSSTITVRLHLLLSAGSLPLASSPNLSDPSKLAAGPAESRQHPMAPSGSPTPTGTGSAGSRPPASSPSSPSPQPAACRRASLRGQTAPSGSPSTGATRLGELLSRFH